MCGRNGWYSGTKSKVSNELLLIPNLSLFLARDDRMMTIRIFPCHCGDYEEYLFIFPIVPTEIFVSMQILLCLQPKKLLVDES